MDLRFITEQIAGVTVVFGIAAIVAWCLRKQPAASRHMVWWLSTIASLLVPVASFIKPAGAPTMIIAPLQYGALIVAADVEATPKLSATEVLLIVWGVGFAFLLFRLHMGLIGALLRRRSSIAFSRSTDCDADVRLSDRITIPETFGACRPLILLPVEANDWSDKRLKVVIAHERVHVHRLDWLTQLIAQFAACVYWFHPLAWFALSRMRAERELACDDGVLRLGYKNSDYAQHLVDVARDIRSGAEALAPSVAMASRSQLETRVRAILNPSMNRGNVTTITKTAAIAFTAVAIVLFSSVNSSAANSTIMGIVTDISGARVPDAFIVLNPFEKGRKPIATNSNGSGEWEVRIIDPGRYNIEIKKPGFRVYQQQISVTGDTPLRVDSQLNVGSLQETLTVSGQSAQRPEAINTPQRIRVGGNVQAAKLIRKIIPEYPAHLKAAGVTGSVVLQSVISREGDVLNVQVLSPGVDNDLIKAAMDAVAQWKYEPTMLNGIAVEVITMVNINFTLAP